VWPVPSIYKEEQLNYEKVLRRKLGVQEIVVGQSPAGKNVST
jgi:hypothetical protein